MNLNAVTLIKNNSINSTDKFNNAYSSTLRTGLDKDKFEFSNNAVSNCPKISFRGFWSIFNPSSSIGVNEKVSKYPLSSKQKAVYRDICAKMGQSPKSDYYVGFVMNSPAMKDKYWTNLSQTIFWSMSKAGEDNDMCAWKMHLYSDNTDDYIKMAEIVLPYLNKNYVNHKCMTAFRSPEDLGGVQKGKAFTIYPKSIEEMEKIAKDLDSLLRYHRLTKENTQIKGDNQLGNSGRLFYRYELDSGKYAYKNFKYGQFYKDHYDSNRAKRGLKYPYLAADMDISDDIWRNFNPSDTNSHPAVRILKNGDKIKLSKQQKIQFNPEQTQIYLASCGKDGYFLDMESPVILRKIRLMRDGDILTIGRENCDIQIPSAFDKISRNHGYIEKSGSNYIYTDTSLNGTYVMHK